MAANGCELQRAEAARGCELAKGLQQQQGVSRIQQGAVKQ